MDTLHDLLVFMAIRVRMHLGLHLRTLLHAPQDSLHYRRFFKGVHNIMTGFWLLLRERYC